MTFKNDRKNHTSLKLLKPDNFEEGRKSYFAAVRKELNDIVFLLIARRRLFTSNSQTTSIVVPICTHDGHVGVNQNWLYSQHNCHITKKITIES